ncbi:MAG: hypothetical protein NZ992_06800, partial [Candidatus Korarchaeum sp.]|nr:hypothetical protein [Candidatus Korarchaeum sp.]
MRNKVIRILTSTVLILFTTLSTFSNAASSHQYENTLVLVAESPASLMEYLPQVREGRCRLILTDNPDEIANLLLEKGLSFKILKENSGDEIIRGMNPHDLAYTLLYASELGRRVRAEDLPILSERVSDFEIIFSRAKGNISVIFFSSDGSDYAFLAAYTAILKGASLLDMDAGFDPSYLRGVTYAIVVTTPIWKGNSDRYSKLIGYFTKVDSDPYLDIAFGLLTGNRLETPFLMLLADEVLKRFGLREFIGISLVEDLPITRKVEKISSILGLPPKVYYPDLS